MDTGNLSQVEVLKGPSSLISGLDAIGGAVNYVTRQPTADRSRTSYTIQWDSLDD